MKLGPIGARPIRAGLFLCQRLLPKYLVFMSFIRSWANKKTTGLQDHTSSPSASSTLVRSTIRVHRTPPRVRDVRETPL
jgi:hypothetical protein